MRPNEIGREGEEIVAARFGYKRKAASGARWPHKEDLENARELAQVKTTTGESLRLAYADLMEHAAEIGKRHRFFQVVLGPRRAFIFEIKLLDTVERGIGGDV